MNKYKIILLVLLLVMPIRCFASTETFERTKENPLVPKDVEVNENNINDILATPAISSKGKIYDFANVLKEDEEKKIYNQLKSFIKSSKIDAVVVTTNNLAGYDIDKYTYNFYDYNDFKSDGVILVLYLNGSEEPNIFMGNSGNENGKVFTIYTDVRMKQILKYIYSDVKKGNYYKAVSDYVKIIDGFFNIDHNSEYTVNDRGEIVRALPLFEIVTLSLSLTFILIMLLIFRVKGENQVLYKVSLDNYIDKDTMSLNLEKDELFETSLSKKK